MADSGEAGAPILSPNSLDIRNNKNLSVKPLREIAEASGSQHD